MLSHQEVELFERIRIKKWSCGSRRGFVGGSLSLGVSFEVLKVSDRPRLSSLFLWLVDEDVDLSYCSRVRRGPILPTMMIMDLPSETEPAPINCFPFKELPWSWCLFTKQYNSD